MGLFELAVLATMLAPTDAALGKAVVTNPAVPAALREGLNVESGLNDGICVPSRMIEGLIVNGCCCIKYVHLPSQSESLIAKGAT